MTSISDLMATDLATVTPQQTSREAAAVMKDRGVGDVLVVDGDRLVGVVTDRDLAVRVLASGQGPDTSVSEACSSEAVSVPETASLEDAARLMRQHSVRRLPVVNQAGRPVGIISLGDLAMEKDEGSVLADISQAPDNS